MPGHRIFIVIENPKERMEYVRHFEELGFLVDAIPEGSDAVSQFTQCDPFLTVADIGTPGFSASRFLEHINQSKSASQIILISDEPVVEHAVRLMKMGALDYLVKPVSLEQLELCAKRALHFEKQAAPVLEQPVSKKKKVQIITKNQGMEKLLALAGKVAKSSASVLIQGESGTGKELFAQYIHEKSDRVGKPFIAVNCAALPENLLESELFGHEKGAFTGAVSRKTGKFELAHKGTLFLDEITEMQFHLQAKLLRVLQEKVLDRVGGTQPVDVDVRVLATTNRNAKEAVEKGDFRQDLYYRLNTIPVLIPPLKHRGDDLDLLCRFFIKKYSKIDGRNVKGLTKSAAQMLKQHSFPGNVRELENIIHRAVLLAETEWIEPQDLLIDVDHQGLHQPEEISAGVPVEQLPTSLKEMEEKMIFQTLDQTEGNRTHAAKILGISVRTLRNKLNEYKDKI